MPTLVWKNVWFVLMKQTSFNYLHAVTKYASTVTHVFGLPNVPYAVNPLRLRMNLIL